MKPDWTSPDEMVQLFCGDAMELLPRLTAGSVDAVVCDPIWPNVPDGMFPMDCAPQVLFTGAMRLLPEGVRRLAIQLGCNSDPRFLLGVPKSYPFFRACWLEYVRPGYLGRLLYTSDVAYLFGEPPPVRPGNFVISGLCRLVNSKRGEVSHPCPRQPHHVDWLVEKWTADGETILDPFMGSGTTARSCWRLGRRFIGFEKSPDYFAEAVRLTEAELRQPRLFPAAAPVEKQIELFGESA